MARTPDKDLQELIGELRSGPKAPPRAKRTRQKPQTAFLVAAIALIAAGIGYTVYDATRNPAPAVGDAAAPASPVASAAQPGSAAPAAAPAPGAPPGLPPAYSENLRPPSATRDMPVPLASFMPPEELPLPKPGHPLDVYVLLGARLDPYTEQLWIRAGILGASAAGPNPFLRRVRLNDADALTYLVDWHVESVALAPATPQPGQ